MNGWFFQGVMTIVTIYSLFGDDIRQLGFTKEADNTFYSMTCAALCLFSFEIVLACIVKDDYFMGFYFWLDLISTISLFTDIGWVMNFIMGTGSNNSASNAQ